MTVEAENSKTCSTTRPKSASKWQAYNRLTETFCCGLIAATVHMSPMADSLFPRPLICVALAADDRQNPDLPAISPSVMPTLCFCMSQCYIRVKTGRFRRLKVNSVLETVRWEMSIENIQYMGEILKQRLEGKGLDSGEFPSAGKHWYSCQLDEPRTFQYRATVEQNTHGENPSSGTLGCSAKS